MIMTSSPLLASRSHPHTPLATSPTSSPNLRPIASTMARSHSNASGTITPLTIPSASLPLPSNLGLLSSVPIPSGPSSSGPTMPATAGQRSFQRAPPTRPYQSPLCARAYGGLAMKTGKEVEGDTKRFAELVVGLVEDRGRIARFGQIASQSVVAGVKGGMNSVPIRQGRSLGGSLSGSWERERAELIVDIPVWSPGCFQDLSTLHQLRDTTLSHTHAILTHLQANHAIPATYRLLARSGPALSSHQSQSSGWGCIRLAPPLFTSPPLASSPLRGPAQVIHRRRTSFVKPERRVSNDFLSHEHAILDVSDDEDDEGGRGRRSRLVKLKEGFTSGSGSDSEDDEETADVLVSREVEKRGAKEGSAFLMTLHGQPALILI